ncbi:MAG: radical SAM family heme chaperone HemW [Gammaproteobacteria bacterium]|nr:radical SAM family heme chaperone HemW [Gammaproteobacteria bacterium]
MPEFTTLPPLSIYIHIPWCVRKCPYCDFNSHVAETALPEKEYVNALLEDLEQVLPEIWGRRIMSVFIGGGTPSLFSPQAIDQLLSGIRARLQCLPGMEITLEANPGTFEQIKFNEFRAAGINRLSIGIQSFDDEKLQALGRIHDSKEALAAMETAVNAGFENINLDLMFGLPDQSQQQGMADLQTAIDLGPTHISWYQLTIEPNTLFYNQPPPLASDDAIWELQQQGQALLAKQGFDQYEISAYAKSGNQCQHNLNYWQFGDYLALGAGANGKISRADDHSIKRYWQLRQPREYLHAQPAARTSGQQLINEEERIFEFMLNALRLKRGFDMRLFEQHTGMNTAALQSPIQSAIEKNLLEQKEQWLRPTELGYRFLNDLINLFEPN